MNSNELRQMCRDDIKPAFEKDNVAIAFTMDNNFLAYLKVVVRSILANCRNSNIDILIVHGDKMCQEEFLQSFRGIENLSIRFVDASAMAQEKLAPFFVRRGYLPISSTYRLLLPELLPNFDKILYLDVDIVVDGNIAELYNTDLGDLWIGAVVDMSLEDGPPPSSWRGNARAKSIRWARKYNFVPWQGYFNAGVALMNLARLRELRVSERAIAVAMDPDTPYFDQDALNSTCRGHVKYLDCKWNCQVDNVDEYLARNKHADWHPPAILHYVGPVKPWNYMDSRFSETWWQYATDADLLKKCVQATAEECQKWMNEHRKIKHSFSYRLGRFFTKPFRWIKADI